MSRYSLDQFLQETAQKDKGEGLFELENARTLEINLNGLVWMKMGSMIAYKGNVKFEREGMMEHGFDKFLKKALTGEGTTLMKAAGVGKVYIADQGKRITILHLENQAIYVNGNDVLAFEPGIKWDITMMRRIATMAAGGLFNMKLEGTGMIAITTEGEPLTLRVTPDQPVITDPNATVAWSQNLNPELTANITFRSLMGRGSGETYQLVFRGDGFVVVQPYEEVYYNTTSSS
ncbi:AIM24 family protein [Methanocella sp. MCL-LM]|uniref:AIM24 family protein n=1 Tax=Methanocella sp. MCL-LM TaxID=3412035 RepID=UPI003C72289F